MGVDDKVLRNHKQPLGKYLPEQLDALLRPYGFDWCVDYQRERDGRSACSPAAAANPGKSKCNRSASSSTCKRATPRRWT
jgi:hypothetical protein